MSSRSDMNAIVRRALHCPHGWTLDRDHRHPRLVLPDGRYVALPSSPSDVNSARNVANQLVKACGCESFWPRAGAGKKGHHHPSPPTAQFDREAYERRADELGRRHEAERRALSLERRIRDADRRRREVMELMR